MLSIRPCVCLFPAFRKTVHKTNKKILLLRVLEWGDEKLRFLKVQNTRRANNVATVLAMPLNCCSGEKIHHPVPQLQTDQGIPWVSLYLVHFNMLLVGFFFSIIPVPTFFVKQYALKKLSAIFYSGLTVEYMSHSFHTHTRADAGIVEQWLFKEESPLLNRQHMIQHRSSGRLSSDERGQHSGVLLGHRLGNWLHKTLCFCVLLQKTA